MGIRVHKAVGYGITSLGLDEKGECNDPRFDVQTYRALRERTDTLHPEDFLIFCEKNMKRLQELNDGEAPKSYSGGLFFSNLRAHILEEEKNHIDVSRCTVYQDEMGLRNVLLFIEPTCFRQWHRYDDTLDWTEEFAEHGQKNRVVPIPACGVYPFDGHWKRLRPCPESLWSGYAFRFVNQQEFLTGADYNYLVGRNQIPQATTALVNHLVGDYRPTIPLGVLALLLWHEECFPYGMNTIMQDMRPLLYVWWS